MRPRCTSPGSEGILFSRGMLRVCSGPPLGILFEYICPLRGATASFTSCFEQITYLEISDRLAGLKKFSRAAALPAGIFLANAVRLRPPRGNGRGGKEGVPHRTCAGSGSGTPAGQNEFALTGSSEFPPACSQAGRWVQLKQACGL